MNVEENITHYLFQLENVLSGLLTLVSLCEDQTHTMERIIKSVDEKLMEWNKHTTKQRKSINMPQFQMNAFNSNPCNDILSPHIANYNVSKRKPHHMHSRSLYSSPGKITNMKELRKSLLQIRTVTREAPSLIKVKAHNINKKHIHDKGDAHAIREWLFHALDANKHYFRKYLPLFMNNRYDSLQSIKRMTEHDLIRIGIKKLQHRKQILSAISNDNVDDIDDDDDDDDDVVSEASTFTLSVSAPTEAASNTNVQFYARAISDYIITAADQLDLKMNATYSILRTTPSGWWYAMDMQGAHGWVPCNYLQKSEDQQLALCKSFTNITLESSDQDLHYGPGHY